MINHFSFDRALTVVEVYFTVLGYLNNLFTHPKSISAVFLQPNVKVSFLHFEDNKTILFRFF